MPSKIQLDENLWFLYICLQKSDLKTIDFTAVGASTNLKPPAARMRYTRLRRQIESGTLIGTHGTPFSGSADKIYEASTRRKRGTNTGVKKGSDDDETEDEEPVDRRARAKSVEREKGGGKANGKMARGRCRGGGKGKEVKVKVKEEQGSDFSSTPSEYEDSEDEIPLAKLRKTRLGPFPVSPSKPYVSPYSRQPMGHVVGDGEVSRSMAGFRLGTGEGFGAGRDGGYGGLGSVFRSPVGHGGGFANGSGSGGGVGFGRGWGDLDWARWQSRFSGGEEMEGPL